MSERSDSRTSMMHYTPRYSIVTPQHTPSTQLQPYTQATAAAAYTDQQQHTPHQRGLLQQQHANTTTYNRFKRKFVDGEIVPEQAYNYVDTSDTMLYSEHVLNAVAAEIARKHCTVAAAAAVCIHLLTYRTLYLHVVEHAFIQKIYDDMQCVDHKFKLDELRQLHQRT